MYISDKWCLNVIVSEVFRKKIFSLKKNAPISIDCSYIKRPTRAQFRMVVDYPIPNWDSPLVWMKSCGNCTRPRSAVGIVSGNRCESDCRSRSQPGPILSWRLIMKYFLRSFSSLPLNHSRRIIVSYKRKYVHKYVYWPVNCLFKLAQEKSVVWWTDRPGITIAVDLGRKATKQTNLRKQFISVQ